MSNSPKSVRIAMVANQLKYINMEVVKEQLNKRDCIKDWAYIVHDKDLNEKGEKVEPHVHIIMRFKSPQQLKYIGNWFEQKEQYVEAWKGGWTTACRYLTHANDETKHQYDNSEVIANFDYEAEKENIDPKKSRDKRKKEIIDQCADGTIRKHNYTDFIDPHEWEKYSQTVKRQWEMREDKLMNELGERDMRVIYIHGGSGTGKTTEAKRLADNAGMSRFVSGSSNDPLEGYSGQDCLILDDFRPESHKIEDILKMLDNHTASLIKSRYRNKSLAECKLIIITSVLNIDEFWERIDFSEKEPILQFKRRIETVLEMEKDYISVCPYSDVEETHIYSGKYKNRMNELFKKKTIEEKTDHFKNSFGVELESEDFRQIA